MINNINNIISNLEFQYPRSRSGFVGEVEINNDIVSRVLEINLQPFGCDFNQPILENEVEIGKELALIGYELQIHTVT